MKIIERYFALQFISSFFWTITAFVFFYLVFDLFSRLNLIIDGTIPADSVIEYYIAMVPLIFVRICPVAVLLATMYTFANLSKNNELIAAVACGKHPYKIFIVFILLGFLISSASIAVNEKSVPSAASRAYNIRYAQMEEQTRHVWRNRVIYGSGNRRFFIKYLDTSEKTFTNFEITQFSSEGSEIMKFQAKNGRFAGGIWFFENVLLRRFSKDGGVEGVIYADSAYADSENWEMVSGTAAEHGASLQKFFKIDPGIEGISESLDDFTQYRLKYDEMDFAGLSRYVARLQTAGFYPRREIIALHSKIALPFASLVLMMMGIPFAAKQKRGGVMIGFGAALGFALVYYLLMSIGSMLGEVLIHPAAGAWLANAVFFCPGLYFMARAKNISYG